MEVNGKVNQKLGSKADPETDIITVDGKWVAPKNTQKKYYMLNKPRGCVCTTSDPQGRPTVMDFLPPAHRKGLYPVGRLDYASEGLVLFTNDGDFAHKIMHPSFSISKMYSVKVEGTCTDAALEKLRDGLSLKEGFVRPRRVWRGRKLKSTEWIHLELREGRNLEIRRLFSLLGYEVSRLRRMAIGPLELKTLPVAQARPLTTTEIRSLERN